MYPKNTSMKGVFPLIGIIGIIIALVVVVGAAVVLTSHPSTSNSTSTVSSAGGSTVATTSIGSSSSGSGPNSGTGGGPGQWYMSRSEISALTASGGNYSTLALTEANASFRYYMDLYSKNSSFFYNNVTGLYWMSYDLANVNASIIEVIWQSPKAQELFSKSTANQTSSYNVTNVTSGGLTYDYSELNLTSSGYSAKESVLVGWKNQGFVEIIAIGAVLPQAQLASTVAGDIP